MVSRIPDAPGHWWRCQAGSWPELVVVAEAMGKLMWSWGRTINWGSACHVSDDGFWLEPLFGVGTMDRIAKLDELVSEATGVAQRLAAPLYDSETPDLRTIVADLPILVGNIEWLRAHEAEVREITTELAARAWPGVPVDGRRVVETLKALPLITDAPLITAAAQHPTNVVDLTSLSPGRSLTADEEARARLVWHILLSATPQEVAAMTALAGVRREA